MTAKRFLADIAVTIPIAFVVAMAATYGYSLIVHGVGAVDWETSFDLAFVVGIVIPLAGLRDRKAK